MFTSLKQAFIYGVFANTSQSIATKRLGEKLQKFAQADQPKTDPVAAQKKLKEIEEGKETKPANEGQNKKIFSDELMDVLNQLP